MKIDEKDKLSVKENTNHEYIFSYDRYDKLLSSNRIIGVDIDKKKNSTRYLRVRCLYCKTEYDVQYRSLIKKKQKCPYCAMSKGEKRIEKWLRYNNINYIYDSEFFEDLKGVGNGILRPDFILPDYKIWIEYDGEFHYRNMTGTLEKNTVHDERKK